MKKSELARIVIEFRDLGTFLANLDTISSITSEDQTRVGDLKRLIR